MTSVRTLVSLAALACTAAACGCRVENDQHGGADNVKIATPFGGMQVKTNDAAVEGAIGLPDYPGATLVKKDKDDGAADVNMSFGNFRLRVKAVSYRTSDSPEKVQAFYRTALGRYGDVIECSDNRPVGTPTRTNEGLTCDNDKSDPIGVSGDVSSKFELKAGSQQHQHIVAVEKQDGGTKFGLVALDLPGKIFSDKGEPSQ